MKPDETGETVPVSPIHETGPIAKNLLRDPGNFVMNLFYVWRMCRSYEKLGVSPRTVGYILYKNLGILFDTGSMNHFVYIVEKQLEQQPTTRVERK
jgi:hypothetical protein